MYFALFNGIIDTCEKVEAQKEINVAYFHVGYHVLDLFYKKVSIDNFPLLVPLLSNAF